MKKLTFGSVLMLMVMAMSTMLACGDDDSDSKKVDGVNVINGKKIVELSITNIQPYYTIYEVIWDTPIATYKIEYDSEGRLKKILNKNIDIKEGNDGKKTFILYRQIYRNCIY